MYIRTLISFAHHRQEEILKVIFRNFSSTNISAKWSHKDLKPLNEAELAEKFTRGSGPGGQSVNKSSNCVNLRHLPTNIVVQCHKHRSLDQNRRVARQKLQERLDLLEHSDQSIIVQDRLRQAAKRDKKRSRSRKKMEMLKKLKET